MDQIKVYFSSKKLQVVALTLIALVMLVLLVQDYRKAYRDQGNDFTSYLLSAEALLEGENPYFTKSEFTFIYPLFLAILLSPLTVIPYWLAIFIWFGINLAALFFSIRILIRLASQQLGVQWGCHLYPPLAALLLLFFGVIQNNLLNGQVNFPVLLLCVLFYDNFLRKRVLMSSLFLATACAIKLVPLILLVYVMLRKDLRVFSLTLILFTGMCLLPAVSLGTDLFNIYEEYFHRFILGKLSIRANAEDASMFFTLHRFLTFLAPSSVHWLWLKYVALGVVLAVTVIVDLLSLRKSGSLNEVWRFSLYLLAILLITPISETHHLAYFILVASLLVLGLLFVGWPTYKSVTVLMVGCLICFFLGNAFETGPYYFISIALLFLTTSFISLRRCRTEL